VPADIDDETGELEAAGTHLRLCGPLPAQLGVDACGKLSDLERFGDVVVRADLERHHHVDGVGAGREDDDRHFDAGASKPAADVQAGHAGEAEVEEDEIDVTLLGQPQPFGAILGELQGEAVLLGNRGEDVAHRGVIVDHEHRRFRGGSHHAVAERRQDGFGERRHLSFTSIRAQQTCPPPQGSTAASASRSWLRRRCPSLRVCNRNIPA